jgi:N-acetylglucosaminyldiphosphoundecaprenol N-acetyl-beta-D-mannosaminyltransferase
MNQSTMPHTHSFPVVRLLDMDLVAVTTNELLDHVFARLRAGEGGWLVTANLDFLRRHAVDPGVRAVYDEATLTVADGMPLLWAASLQGTRLPERVAGSSLTPQLIARAEQEGRSVYLLGGNPNSNQRASELLAARHPRLEITGHSSPFVHDPPTPEELASLVAELGGSPPDLLLVGLGSPKQERLIQALRPHLPRTWMVGVGITFSFIAGDIRRAPRWMQATGLEWVHRLVQEPKRLARRYLVDDVPFALSLLARGAMQRYWPPGKAPGARSEDR